MNRKYNCEEFEKSVNIIRNAFSDVALTTDIIVGFPGETEKEFEKTYKFLQKIDFSKMHIFKYSRREGTVAYNMKNQIKEDIKELRSKELIELSNKNEENFLNCNIGKKVEVLFEQKEGEYIKGHTTNYIVVKAKGKALPNTLETVNIIEKEGLELIGTM